MCYCSCHNSCLVLLCVIYCYNNTNCCDDVGIEDAVDVHNASVYCAGVSRGSDDGSLVTSGGRVLTVVVTDCDVKTAAKNAQHAVQAVNFTGKTYRTDIALKALRSRFVTVEYIPVFCVADITECVLLRLVMFTFTEAT